MDGGSRARSPAGAGRDARAPAVIDPSKRGGVMSKDLNAHESIREGKRAQFAQEAEGRSHKNTVKLLALVAVALVAVVVYVVAGAGGERGAAVAGGLRVAGEEVSLPVSELSGKARFYEYKSASGKTVRFFVMKSSDGVYRAALDACD